MRIPLVDLKAQYESIRGEVTLTIEKVLEETAFVLGENVRSFEEAFAAYCTSRHAVGVGSGTSALHLALLACGVGEGDEVITVPNTFFATAEAIVHSGAKVVFVDVDPETLNMDVNKLRAAVTGRTKVVIPVHLFGNPADMDGVMEVVGTAGIDVIEDAAQAHGALYHGRRAGSIGRAGCFSFYPGKNLGAYGEGGAVVTDDDTIAVKIRMFRDHGRIEGSDHGAVGYNERLDGLQAAVLRTKLGHLEEWNSSRRRIAGLYTELLEDVPAVFPVRPLKGTTPARHLYVIRVEEGSRDELKQYLFERGIMACIHYMIPLHQTTALRCLGYQPGDFPAAEEAAAKILSLPLFPEMRSEQIEYVVNSIRKFASC